jgi:hypothetical protein
MAQSPLLKVGRVKVGVRCRPAFQDEIDFAKGEFMSIVDQSRSNWRSFIGTVIFNADKWKTKRVFV